MNMVKKEIVIIKTKRGQRKHLKLNLKINQVWYFIVNVFWWKGHVVKAITGKLGLFHHTVQVAIPPSLSEEIAQSTAYHHLRQMEVDDMPCNQMFDIPPIPLFINIYKRL